MRVILLYLLCFFSLDLISNDLKLDLDKVIDFSRSGDMSLAQESAENLLNQAKLDDNAYFTAKAYYLLGYFAEQNNDFGNSVIYYLEGARYAESTDGLLDNDLIGIYKNLAIIMGDYNHFELAHKFIDLGLDYAQTLNDSLEIQILINNRIHELLAAEDYDRALNEIAFLENNFELIDPQYNSLRNKKGIALRAMGQLKQALQSYFEVIQNKDSSQPKIYSSSLINIGDIYALKGQTDLALKYYHLSNDYNIQNQLYSKVFESLMKLGEVQVSLGHFKEGINYFEQIIEILDKDDQIPETHTVYRELSNAYTQLGDYQKALEYEKIYTTKLEEFIAEQKEIEELDKKYNIQLLTERYFDMLAANEAKKQTERYATIGIAGTVLLFLIALTFIYTRQSRTKRSIADELRKIEFLSEV